MTVGEVAQLIAALAIVAGAAYWGGQVKSLLGKLCEVTHDHEGRIRTLEGRPGDS